MLLTDDVGSEPRHYNEVFCLGFRFVEDDPNANLRWRTHEANAVKYDLANLSQSTNNGDNSISLSQPENFGTLLDYETKDGKNIEISRNSPMQSIQKQKLTKHYANADHVLKQMKEKENIVAYQNNIIEQILVSIQHNQEKKCFFPNTIINEYFVFPENYGCNQIFITTNKMILLRILKQKSIILKCIRLYKRGHNDDGYRFCEDLRRKQILALEDILFDPTGGIKTSQRGQKEEISTIFAKHLSDVAKLSSNVSSVHVAKAFVMDKNTKDKYRKMTKLIQTYILECVQLCWLMHIQTPPLCLDLKTIKGQVVDKNSYMEYTKKGKKRRLHLLSGQHFFYTRIDLC
ncbi:hypothetical protein ACJMK2_031574 [Sinanodonta woodiana]|uniref:Mitochondria-eating protein C-terminal domain-containing protein n=1 Tax=Sinanodonta woodiana TaxID=1069815 RepID=A0ABD3WZ71_SINWO